MDRDIEFPSMVNAILELGESRAFVGCKHDHRTLNIVHPGDLQILRSFDDEVGGGIYNAIHDGERGRIVSVTRNGYLSFHDQDSLKEIGHIQLSEDARVWSLAMLRNGDLVAGDYSGNLFMVDRDLKIMTSANLAAYTSDEMPQSQRIWQPSVFGLCVNSVGHIIASTRWGELFWIAPEDGELQLLQSGIIREEITHIESVPSSQRILVGTRSGKILSMSETIFSDSEIEVIVHRPPAMQHDNSVWSLSCMDRDALACFSDGQVISINLEQLDRSSNQAL